MPVFETSTFAQVSPQGRQDFTAPVTYTVDNGVNVKTYQVEVVAESDVEIEKSLLLEETFSGCTAGTLPSGGSVYGAGTNAGGRYSTGGANTDTNHIITMAEGENKWVRATVGKNSAQWTLMATTSVLQEEVRQSQSLLLKFKIRIPSGKLENGRMALLGLDESGNQMPTGDDDNDEHKEVMYFGESAFTSAHKSTGESRTSHTETPVTRRFGTTWNFAM